MMTKISEKTKISNIYKLIGILGLTQAIIFFFAGIISNIKSGFIITPGKMFEYFADNKLIVTIISIIEIIYAILYIIPLIIAFIYDFKNGGETNHLISIIALEFIIFSSLRIFEIIGSNLLLFVAIALLIGFLIGGSAYGLIFLVDIEYFAGSVFVVHILNFLAPALIIIMFITSIIEFFE